MRVLLSWSGGKDSALTLAALRRRGDVDVAGLLTTFGGDRVSMHGVPPAVIEAQAAALDLPLWPARLPEPCPNDRYAEIMGAICALAREQGIAGIAFGDLFLEDIRRYREDNLARASMQALFPLWSSPDDTAALAREAAARLDARVVCVDPQRMPAAALGGRYDHAFLDALPPGVDPMGERGEFHTLVVGGEIFAAPLPIEVGPPVVERDGFLYATAALSARRRR